MLSDQLENLLSKEAQKLKTLQFAMKIPTLDLEYSFSTSAKDQQYHAASIGKLMTASLLFMGIEKKGLSIHTPIREFLEKEVLTDLYVYQGKDYQHEVTLEHLLGHCSGINDYFEGKTLHGPSFIDLVIQEPHSFWIPQDLVEFTRTRQKAIGKPGERFLYSDTGYVLLGLIVEKIMEMPFHQALEKYIFKPLGMTRSGLSFYSENFDQSQLAPLWIEGVDVHLFKSLSCDFSGGGIFTTADELVNFLQAFHRGELFSKGSLTLMEDFKHRFHRGIHYGLGLMELRFKEFFFLLKHLPNVEGHLGITASHAWYHPQSEDVYVLNLGNTKEMTKSFRLLIKILQLVEKEKKRK